VGIGGFESIELLSVRLEVFGRQCAVLSPAGLIQSKRASGRAKDLLVIPELEALKEMQESPKGSQRREALQKTARRKPGRVTKGGRRPTR